MQKATKTLVMILNEDLNNFKISQSNFKAESEFVDRLVVLYQKLIGQLSERKEGVVPILSMYWSCLRNLVQASIFAFEGHIPEVYTLLSKSAESLATARKLYLNPELRSVWITKADMSQSQYKKAWGKPFPEDDIFLHPEIYKIYDLGSDYGRHPNLSSSMFNIDMTEFSDSSKVTFKYNYLPKDELRLQRTIDYLINCYILFANKFAEIFGENVSNLWLIELKNINSDFRKHIESTRFAEPRT